VEEEGALDGSFVFGEEIFSAWVLDRGAKVDSDAGKILEVSHRLHLICGKTFRLTGHSKWAGSICAAANLVACDPPFTAELRDVGIADSFSGALWIRCTMGRFGTSVFACYLLARVVPGQSSSLGALLEAHLEKYSVLWDTSRTKSAMLERLSDPATPVLLTLAKAFLWRATQAASSSVDIFGGSQRLCDLGDSTVTFSALQKDWGGPELLELSEEASVRQLLPVVKRVCR